MSFAFHSEFIKRGIFSVLYKHSVHASVCMRRYPLPSHYTITLEVSRDRATAAYYSLCDSGNPVKPKCPPPLKDGDTRLQRALNEPCDELVCMSTGATLHQKPGYPYLSSLPLPLPYVAASNPAVGLQASQVGSGMEPQPKLNSVHLGRYNWHLVRTFL